MKKRALLGYMQNEKATRPRERQPPRVCVSFCSGVSLPNSVSSIVQKGKGWFLVQEINDYKRVR
jgi:hypothetical protein